MQKSKNFFRYIPEDILRQILSWLDYGSIENFILSIKGNRRMFENFENMWHEKALKDFGEKYWTNVHELNFKNYLIVKVRYLTHKHSILTSETFGKFPTENVDGFGLRYFIDPKFPENRNPLVFSFTEWTGISTIWKINDFEVRKGNQKPFHLFKGVRLSVDEIKAKIGDYYSDVIKSRKEAIDIRNEIVKIGKYLASSLALVLEKDSRYRYYISKEAVLSDLFIHCLLS